jgi:integrase/recombinase XerD
MNNIPNTGELFATDKVSPDTERCYKYQMRNFAQWMQESQGKVDMDQVTTADLLTYRQSIEHLASSTQNRCLAVVKSFFNWVLDMEIISKNSVQRLKLPKSIKNRPPVYLAFAETRKLLATAELPRDKAFMCCIAYELRISELNGLDIDHIAPPTDARSAAITVVGKGVKERFLPICDEAFNVLSAYIGKRTTGAVFLVLNSSRLTTKRALQDRFIPICKKAGIPEEKTLSTLYASLFRDQTFV